MRLRLLLPICLAAACGEADAGLEPEHVEVEIVVPKGGVEKLSADGECATGCTIKKHPVPPFMPEQFAEALADYAKQPIDQESDSLNTLLFYGQRTEELIAEFGTDPLPPAHAEFLKQQLRRRFATSEIRLVEPDGTIRGHIAQRVPIGIKRHLHPEVTNLQPIEFNGTVMRVGLNTVWSRY